MPYRYILRYYIDPGYREEERIEELIGFCRENGIAEVMFFYNAEELFQGYPPESELNAWFDLAVRLRRRLAENHLDMSVNPWTTLVHCARGRKLSAMKRDYQLMVGENGVRSSITACPFCPAWQRDIAAFFARIAAEVHPVAIWIEDDWRLHNHGSDMGYGGCFCPLHLARFSARIGRPVTREELMDRILAPNNDLVWRRHWLEVNRESLLEPAAVIQQAVHAADPAVRLGLMSSQPDVHSVEGRDWPALKEHLAPGPEPLLFRPHLPPYTESYPLLDYPAVTRQAAAEFEPGAVEIYPELENSPRCGAYSKSAAYSAWECLNSVLYGAQGITINHYDMMGNGIALDPVFGSKLKAVRPRLDTLCQLGLTEQNQQGVDVFFSPEVAAWMKPDGGQSCSTLINHSVSWSKTLGILGISHRLTASYDPARLTALSGQTARACSKDQLKAMLSGSMLLDADSAAILLERGMGPWIGLRSAHWVELEDCGYAYEELDCPLAGLPKPRLSAQRITRLRQMEPEPSAAIRSNIHRYDRKALFPGFISYRNQLGGLIHISAYPMECDQFFMAYFNVFRRDFLQQIVRESSGNTEYLFGLDAPLMCYRNHLPDRTTLLSLLNPTRDPLTSLRFEAPGLDGKTVSILSEDGVFRPVAQDLEQTGERVWRLNRPLAATEAVWLLVRP